MSFEILGVDLYHILSWFIVYSFMGWIWESCYVSAKSKKWVNRGFVSGPFVTIYGVGAVTVYVILRPVAGNILELYFAGVAVATILEYVTALAMASREDEMIRLGVSPRGALAVVRMAKARAYLKGRDYVTPEDVQRVFVDVCGHRIILNPRARVAELTAGDILKRVMERVKSPDSGR